MQRVNQFKYLGSTVQDDGGSEAEVAKRIQAGWNNWRKVTGILCDKKVSPKVKGKIHKTMVRPAILYGLEILLSQRPKKEELKLQR